MADLAPTRAGDLRITTLAAQIRAAQAAQITAMAAWLHAWGQVTPPLSHSQQLDVTLSGNQRRDSVLIVRWSSGTRCGG
jgi:uncharacterized protein (DUF305 family)